VPERLAHPPGHPAPDPATFEQNLCGFDRHPGPACHVVTPCRMHRSATLGWWWRNMRDERKRGTGAELGGCACSSRGETVGVATAPLIELSGNTCQKATGIRSEHAPPDQSAAKRHREIHDQNKRRGEREPSAHRL
jgi:hypothetical protein